MKKENDELTNLFRSNLEHAELTPRDDFWNEIQSDMVIKKRQRFFYHIAAAVSVFIITASAALFYMNPHNDTVKQDIAKPIVKKSIENNPSNSEKINNITAKVSPKAIYSQRHLTRKAFHIHKIKQQSVNSEEDSTATLTLHMSIRYNEGDNTTYNNNNENNNIWQTGGLGNGQKSRSSNSSKEVAVINKKEDKSWTVKTGLNIGLLSTGFYDCPIGGSITLEKQLSKYLSLESGIQYAYLHSDGQSLHYIGIPVKTNLTLAESDKIKLYAIAGGVADKCVSANENSSSEPIQLTALAGVGVRYRFNKALSIYAEPTFAHYFNNRSNYDSFRTKRKNTINFQCGLALTY